MKITKVKNISDLLSILAKNELQQIIIFKHSPYCSISAYAKSIFESFIDSIENKTNLLPLIIDVIEQREISNYIAQTFNVRHQSPQVLFINREKSLQWHTSHYDITIENLNSEIKSNLG